MGLLLTIPHLESYGYVERSLISVQARSLHVSFISQMNGSFNCAQFMPEGVLRPVPQLAIGSSYLERRLGLSTCPIAGILHLAG